MTTSSRVSKVALLCLLAFAARSSADADRRVVNDGAVILESVPEISAELAESLDRYLNTRGAVFRDWTRNGDGVYITTRFGNTSQIHRVDMPGGARRQLTFFDEPVGAVERRPGADLLTFLMDAGGNEFSQIFLLDPKTGRQQLLSDGSSRNGSVSWNDDGSLMAFRSTRRNGRSNDVWLVNPADPSTARILVESPDGTLWVPMDWKPGGRALLIANYVSVTDSRIHLLDLETGSLRLLAGSPDDPVSVLGAGGTFSADGSGIYFATDSAGDFNQLVHMELESGETRIITDAIPWNVDDFELSEDGARGAFVVNEAGIDRLYLFDPGSGAYTWVEDIPLGLVSTLGFSPDASSLAMTLNTPRSPSDVYVLALGQGALEWTELIRWTYSEVGGLDTEAFVEPELVYYPTFDAREIPAFLYRPPGKGPFPVIIAIHGGPESQYRPRFSSTFQSWLAELGAAVIAPNVRGSSGYGKSYVTLDNGFEREDSVRDIGALLDWIAARGDLDGSRVAVYGGSYGGYMVLASLVHYSDRLKCGVDVVGISNFVTFLENTQDYRRDLRRVEYGDERDPGMREFLEEISPANNAERITAPLFVAQGQNDPRVPASEAEQIVKVVRDAGFDVWYMNALNEGHGFRKKENADLYRQIVVAFLRTHLLGPDTQQAGEGAE